MSGSVIRAIRITAFAVIAGLFITFAIDNRHAADINFFPLPYVTEMPVFLFAMLCFMLGALIGGLSVGFTYMKTARLLKMERSHVSALQNENMALRAEGGARLPELPTA